LDRFSIELPGGSPPSLGGLAERSSWRDGNDNVCARVYRTAGTRLIDWSSLGLFAIQDGSSLIRAWPYPESSSAAVAAHARERLQPLLLQTRRCQVLHASAVVIDSAAIAIAGVSGSGKSTLAFALFRRGHRQVADDAVVIDANGRPARVLHLPFRPQLHDGARALSPAPPAAVEAADESSPLCAVVLLGRTALEGDYSLERISGTSACISLMMHAHVFDEEDRDGRHSLVGDYARLADEVPIFRLTFYPRFEDLSLLTDAIEALGNRLHQ